MPRRKSSTVLVHAATVAGVRPAAVRRWVSRAADQLRLPAGVISVAFVSPTVSRQLNTRYRHKRRPTDVLSFRYRPAVDGVMGELVLCPAVIRREVQPKEYTARIRFLIEHGLIHLTGRDHQTSAEHKVWAKIEQSLRS